MRLLFAFAGGRGHLEPLLPIALAAAAAGHEVAFAARPWMAAQAEALGFCVFRAGSDAGLAPQHRPLQALDPEREALELCAGFARRIARERAPGLLEVCRAWQPSAVVWEETDFAAPIVAERLGLPHASLIVLAAGTYVTPQGFGGALDELRAEHGLPPDPELAMLSRALVLCPLPPGYRDPASPLPSTARALRPTLLEPGPGAAPALPAQRPGVPTVYLTLGTVFPLESGDLFERAIAGLRELPIELWVTVGEQLDPAAFGAQPAHVHIARFIPQAVLLPRADLLVSHAGSGSVIGGLIHGLPMLLIPLGADQPLNAARCRALGLARVLDPLAASPAAIRTAAAELLVDAAARAAAQRLQREIQALPPPDHAVAWLEALVRAH